MARPKGSKNSVAKEVNEAKNEALADSKESETHEAKGIREGKKPMYDRGE